MIDRVPRARSLSRNRVVQVFDVARALLSWPPHEIINKIGEIVSVPVALARGIRKTLVPRFSFEQFRFCQSLKSSLRGSRD